MKKTLVIFAILIVSSFLCAEGRYITDISYYDDSGAHTMYYTSLPSTTITEIGVCYTPVYPITNLEAANFYSYGIVGTPTALVCRVYLADVNGFPTGTAQAAVSIPRANVTTGAWNTVDLSTYGLSYAAGQKFVITYSVTGGTPTTAVFQFLLNRIDSFEFPSHSVRYLSGAWVAYQGVTLPTPNSGGEYHFSATVDYSAPFHDLMAQSLWFTGDLILEQGASIAYEADVKNTGDQPETNILVTVEISDITYPSRTIVYTDTQIIPSLAAGDSIHIDTFPAYTYSAVGEYIVRLYTGLAGDMEPTNDEIQLEQQIIVLPATLTYDDGVAESAWALNAAGGEYGNEFECPIAPYKINQIHYYIYPDTWPVPGSNSLGIAIYDDDGLDYNGDPNAPGTELFYQEVTVTRGAWNTFDVSSSNLVLNDGKFFVTARFLQDFPNCPGLAVDSNLPHSAWKVSWNKYLGDWYQSYADFDDDWMIRATVDFVDLTAPQDLIIVNSNDDIILTWTSVAGANSYKVYQGSEPGIINNLIGQNIIPTTYTHTNGALDNNNFYLVRASTDIRRNNNGMTAYRPVKINSQSAGKAIGIPVNSAD